MTKAEMRTSEANLKLINQAVQDYLMNLDLFEGKYETAGWLVMVSVSGIQVFCNWHQA